MLCPGHRFEKKDNLAEVLVRLPQCRNWPTIFPFPVDLLLSAAGYLRAGEELDAIRSEFSITEDCFVFICLTLVI